MKRVLIWILALGIGCALFAMPRAVESSIPSIYYVTPDQKRYETVISCSGTVEAGELREIYLEASAVPVGISVRAGDRVEAGDIIMRVETAAAVPAQDEGYALLDTLTSRTELLGLADTDFSALLALYGLSAITGEGLDVAALLSGLTETASSSRKAGSVVGQVVPREQEIVLAPISGVVIDVAARENVSVSSGRPALTISDGRSFVVLAAVSEGDISKVREGNAAQIRCSGNPGKTYSGVVSRIYPTAYKVVSGTSSETVVDVEILLIDGDGDLKPGFTARADIEGGDDYRMITVPYEAIRQDENNEEYVYVYRGGGIEKQPVITGREMLREVEILHGLELDSIVIYNPDDIAGEGAVIQLKGRADID